MMLPLMLISMMPQTGCVTVHEISPEKEVHTLHAGQPFTPPVDGKFVPLARWDEMLDTYIRASTKK